MADGLNFAPVAHYTPPAAPAGNPLALVTPMLQAQQLANQNQLFQQQFQANQAIGQIMATAPNIDEGLKRVTQSPYSAFAGPAVAAYRGAEQAQSAIALQRTQMQGALMDQYQKGAASAIDAMYPALADPFALFDKQMKTTLATFPPELRPVMQSRLEDLRTAVLSGLDPKDPKAKEQAQARMVGAMTQVVPAERLFGKTESQDVGNATEIYRLPAPWEDQNKPRQLMYSIPKGTAPRTDEGGMLVPGLPAERAQQPGTAGPQVRAEGPLPMLAQQPSGEIGPLGLPGNAPPGAQLAQAPQRPAGQPGKQTSGGYSMIPEGGITPDMIGRSYSTEQYHAPSNTMIAGPATPAERSHEANLQERFSKEDYQRYTAAQSALKQMPALEQDIKNAIKAGFEPGAGAPLKVEVAKAYKSVLDLLDPNRDKSKDIDTSSAESAMKTFTRLGIDAAKAQLNQPQIAAESLFKGLEGNPSFTNTDLGLKLIMSAMKSDLQREVDRRLFSERWRSDPKNHGNLNGADAAFDRMFPVSDYAKQVLDEHRMLMKGNELKFKDAAAVKKAYEDGLLTRDQAIKLGKEQGL